MQVQSATGASNTAAESGLPNKTMKLAKARLQEPCVQEGPTARYSRQTPFRPLALIPTACGPSDWKRHSPAPLRHGPALDGEGLTPRKQSREQHRPQPNAIKSNCCCRDDARSPPLAQTLVSRRSLRIELVAAYSDLPLAHSLSITRERFRISE
jgi:hypothetical protein